MPESELVRRAATGTPDDRSLADRLQHRATTQLVGVPNTGSSIHIVGGSARGITYNSNQRFWLLSRHLERYHESKQRDYRE